MPHLDKFPKLGYQEQVICSHLSDGSEPSWLEPELELKNFRLGSWPFSLQLENDNWPKQAKILIS